MVQIKQLITSFELYAYGQSLHAAFTEFLNWTLLPFRKYDTAPEQQQALDAYQNHPKTEQLVNILNIVGELSEGFADPLGEFYMQAISNGHNGQYFTPEPLCEMIAAMQIAKDLQPGQTVYDCACGSGRMLLAAAKINRHALFYGADLDNICCKMALINMLLNSLQGEIAHMDSLSNEFHTGYRVCTTLVGTHNIPYYIEFTEPEQSNIWLKPTQQVQTKPKFDKPFKPVSATISINGIQGTLF